MNQTNVLHWSFVFRRSRRQDVKHGDPLRQCRGFNAKGTVRNVKFFSSSREGEHPSLHELSVTGQISGIIVI